MKQVSAKKLCYNVLNFKNGITILKGVVIFLLFISAGATARTNFGTAPGKTNSVNTPPPACQAGFTDSTSNRVAYFTSTSTDTNASTEYRWQFGDGGISHQKNPVHRFADAGTYTVCLTIKNTALSCEDSICHSVTITQCMASYITTVDTNNLKGSFVYITLTSNSTNVEPGTQYRYSNDTVPDGGPHSPNFSGYVPPGAYQICLTIQNTNTGCLNTFCDTVKVPLIPITCNPTFDTSVAVGTTMTFTNTTKSPDSSSVAYGWQFGDGSQELDKNPQVTHTYTTPGTYQVCLYMGNPKTDCENEFCENVVIPNGGCTAAFTDTTDVLRADFTNASTGIDGSTTYHWYFGDGSISHQQSPTHLYSTTGTFTVCLVTSTPDLSCSDSVCHDVTITQCQAAFDTLVVGQGSINGYKLTVTSKSTGVDGNTVYDWDFGDGGIGHQPNQEHIYHATGKYLVCLTISNTVTGCSSQFCEYVTITLPVNICGADFTSSSNGTVANFTSTSTDTTKYTRYKWDFGDGGISHQINPQHTYATTGKYDVCLTITDSSLSFCDSTFCDSITITPLVSTCTAAFSSSTDDLVANFTNSSTGTNGSTTYKWNFGDGGTSNQMNPTHRYIGGAGNYTACLTIKNVATGCYDSVCHTVTITQCQASFDTTVTGSLLTVTSTSTGVDANTVYTWSFGDGGIGHQVSQSHTYGTPGTYNVCLTISNSTTGCSNTFCENVTTLPFVSSCTASFDTAMNGNVLTVTSTSTGVDANTKYTWSFGDGGIGHSATQSHTYKSASKICSVPITLNNGQGTPTSANFQQMITINSSMYSSEENAGLQNIEFTTGADGSGTPLQAWIESGNSSSSTNTVYWVNLGSSIVPANGSLTIYMTFMSSSVLSSAGPTGEAPQLSGTYGQYDNGSLVFPNFYDNFTGTSLSTNWTNTGATGVTVNNGLTLTYQGPNWYGIYTNTFSAALNTVAESYCSAASTNGQGICINTSGVSGNGVNDGSDGIDAQLAGPANSGYMFGGGGSATSAPNANLTVANASPASNTYYVLSFFMASTPIMQLDYGAFTSLTCTPGGDDISANSAVGLGVSGNDGSFQWFRDRAYPPNGIMPTATEEPLTCQSLNTTFDVCLTITNGKTGCSSTTCTNVVTIPPVSTCQASFDTSVTYRTVTLTNTSTGTDPNTKYDWNFGDGGISHQQNPTHTYPTKGICSVGITINNNQSSPTPTGFQQQVVVNSSQFSTSESPGLQNVEFTANAAAGQGGTTLNAWLESGDSTTSTNSTWWVNLGNNVVPANGNLTIYINFLGTNVMSANGVTGEAPQLSATYGQFDNGALVFPFYDNFAGTVLSNNWTQYDSGTGTIVVDNGITITSEDVDPQAANVITSANSYPANIIAETYASTPGNNGGVRSYQPAVITNTAADEGVWVGDGPFSTGQDGGGANPTGYVSFSNGRSSAVEYAFLEGSPTSSYPYADYDDYDGNNGYNGYNVWSIVYTGSTNSLYQNYSDLVDANSSFSPTGNVYVALGIGEYGAGSTSTFSAYWARTRQYAPNGVMPSANLGSLTCQAAGNKYDVCLTISNSASGCFSTTCDSVTLLPYVSTCQAGFTYTDTNLVAVFANTSTGTNNGTTYNWNFGDGGISHQQNPTHHYSSGGTYTACLTIQNLATGCFDSICQSVILTQCQASFDTSVNFRTVQFTSTSTDTTDSTHYFWSFGDGTISHQQNPTHTYKDSAKSVCFSMITVSNNQGTAIPTGFQQQVIVNSSNYSASELAGLQNVEFTIGGAAGAGTVLNAWLESGDTNTSTNTVWWVNLGNSVIPANSSVTLYMNFMSSAVMSASGATGEAPELSTNYGQYDNGASVFPFYDNFAGTALSGNWSTPFASGSGTLVVNNGLTITSESTDPQAANVISSVNSFSPNVIAETYAGNCNQPISGTRSYMPGLISESAVAEGVIIVDQNWPSAPNDSYVCYSNGRAFGQYTFLQGTPTSPSPYADYNEGNPPNPPSGNNILGLVYTGSANSLFVNYADVADGNSQWSPSGNLYFALGIAEYGATDPSTFTSYWARTRQDPPNGVMPGTSAASLSCEPPGTYDVCLTISNSTTGCSSTSCENVTVTPAVNVCGADFTNTTGSTLVHFTSTSTDTTVYTKYKWTFGDGDISHQVNPQHTYADTGMYNVCLTITDSSESFCDSTFCNTIHVTNVNVCGANFSETSNGTLANFTSTSTGTSASTKYKWTFGDGDISHQQNPQHTYAAIGKYDVCLTITDSSGAFCDSTFCDSITLTTPVSDCTPDFTFTQNGTNFKVNFVSTSSDTTDATEYRWHFGDKSGKDTISHQRNPLHAFKAAGTYTVCLTLLDSTLSYCDSTVCKDVTVTSPTSECTAHFTWVNVKGQGVHFYSNSQDTTSATRYSWNLGDGTELQNEVDPSHRYAGSGDYYVCLTITDTTETFCNSTYCDSVDFIMTGIDDLSFPGTSLYYDEASSQLVLNWVGNDNVNIHLVDILGRDAQDIYMGNLSTGSYRFTVNSSFVATGIYFVHITAADGDKAWKIFVLPH